MNDLDIRNLKVDDTPDICRIYSDITNKAVDEGFRRVVEEHANRNEDDICLVAEQDGRVVGFMFSYILMGSFGASQSVLIPMLGVDPAHMGQGIGKALAEAIFHYYRERGIRRIYTSVRWFDTDLLSFFKLLGFDRSEFINLKKILDT